MDSRARLALEQLARQAVSADLDSLSLELRHLRHEVAVLRGAGPAAGRAA